MESSKEEFSKKIIQYVENQVLESLLLPAEISQKYQSLELASNINITDLEKAVNQITLILKFPNEIDFKIQNLLEIFLFSLSEDTESCHYKVSLMFLSVSSELLVSFDSLDGLQLWTMIFNFLVKKENPEKWQKVLQIEVFYETLSSFIKSYLSSLQRIEITDYEIDFAIPEDFVLFNQIEFSKVIILIRSLLNSPLEKDFSINLFSEFKLSEELLFYIKSVLRSLEC